ncbi:MAG: RNA polymerase sigma-70 factor [Dysgonamonadaceae bacterium]|jgi:RNA polymerase sigma-70 factor (ECF subfamily)|nr:RNA polymerase sigma-70 factor [Dysgonamonadaceae bacterium]
MFDHTNIDFDFLFEKYYPGLLFYATQFLDEAEAKDVVQDVFFEFWKKRDTLVISDKIGAYLYRLVYTHSINILNHKKVELKYSNAMVELNDHKINFYESEINNDIIRNIESKEIENEINAAIGKLPDKCREIFKLSYLYDLKNKEISDVMKISLRTVEAHIYKALKTLRKELKHLLLFFILFS